MSGSVAFTSEIMDIIETQQYTLNQVINIDQSRFEKELHIMRTHAFMGPQGIEMLIGSAMATSHCYMIYPAITMADLLLSPMYVLVSGSRGQFPQKHSDPANIRSYASKTANMNKSDTLCRHYFFKSHKR